jgi:hypothetical protein
MAFDRARMVLDNNSTVVNSASVLLHDSQCFVVAPTNPTCQAEAPQRA